MTDWTADSTQALCLSLVRASADRYSPTHEQSFLNFHPRFTYPIYGDDEKIYGYKDLTIDLKFSSGSLTQRLDVRCSEKLTSSTVDDVEGTLARFLPQGYHSDEGQFLQQVEDDAISFQPHGNLIHSYICPSHNTLNMRTTASKNAFQGETDDDSVAFEVYHSTWNTSGFRNYHRRLQLFVLLYIEGGSYINENEDPWEFMVLYEKRRRKGSPTISTYHLVGYSSLYNFYFFPEKVRMRLSQFIILPPYQRQGHGSELYKAIYHYICSQPHIAELTVEDPAEEFEDLRDKNDLRMLLAHQQFMEEAFGTNMISYGGGRVGGIGKARKSGRGGKEMSGMNGKLGPPADKAWIERWRRELKIAGRQFQRLVEMLVLSRLDPSNTASMKAYRLQVKERLYRFNYEILAQLEKKERLDKLEETFESVQSDYRRILRLTGCF
ncbi:hypothetical protein AX17_001935 [Amanita inopinata Kibby_2008]|nr:hypothetical protein AX17_001935 [Amanita inopinata Kibby_2008]